MKPFLVVMRILEKPKQHNYGIFIRNKFNDADQTTINISNWLISIFLLQESI